MKTIPALAVAAALCCLGMLAQIREGAAAAVAKQSPFYCDTAALDPPRRTRHFDVLGPELVAKREAVRELRDGYEFDFPSDPETFRQLVEWVDGERECCPFFDISVRAAPEHGPLTMKVTGRPGTKEFIKTDGASWIKPIKPAMRRGAQAGDAWIGRPAPDFRLEGIDGGTVSLAQLRGQVVLVNFWATWCGPCKMEMPWLAELQRRHRRDGLVVVGISLDDSAERVREFAKIRNVSYTIALKDASVIQAYGGARFLPQTFFVGRDGNIVARSYGIVDRKTLEADVKRAMDAAPA